MELIYYFSSKDLEYTFTTEYVFEYDKDNTLLVKRNEKNLKNFYSKNNIKINLIAGKNGVGKTFLMRSIYSQSIENDSLFVYQKENDLYYYSNKEWEFLSEEAFLIKRLDEIEMIRLFFSNSLELLNGSYQRSHKLLDISTSKLLLNKSFLEVQLEDFQDQITFINTQNSINKDITNLIGNLPKAIKINSEEIILDFWSKEVFSNYLNMHEKTSLKNFFYDEEKNTVIKEVLYKIKITFVENLLSYYQNNFDELIKDISNNNFLDNSYSEEKLEDEIVKLRDEIKKMKFKNQYKNGDRETIIKLYKLERYCLFKTYELQLNKIASEMSDEGTKLIEDLNKSESFVISLENKMFNIFLFTLKYIRIEQISWNDISSGQYYFLNLFSRINKIKPIIDQSSDSVILCVDEVDLGLHPEWQRKWINRVPDIIYKLLNLEKNNRLLQIVVSTHAPVILSDMKKEDIVFLEKNNPNVEETFAQNIHILFSSSFFLSNTIGELAEKKIKELSFILTSINEQISLFDVLDCDVKNKNYFGNMPNEVERIIFGKFKTYEIDQKRNFELLFTNEELEYLNSKEIRLKNFEMRFQDFRNLDKRKLTLIEMIEEINKEIRFIGDDIYRRYLEKKCDQLKKMIVDKDEVHSFTQIESLSNYDRNDLIKLKEELEKYLGE